MAKVRFSNFASSRLAAPVGVADTSFVVTAGEGAEFPILGSDDVFYAVVVEGQGSNVEIVRATARAGDRITVERGVGGTIARSWTVNAVLELRPLAEAFDELQSNVRSARGKLIATSGVLPAAAADQDPFFVANWTLEPGLPTGVRYYNGLNQIDTSDTRRVNSDWIEFPATRPEENITGVWIVALVDDVEVSEMFVTWGGSGSVDDSATVERVVGPLKFREAVPGPNPGISATGHPAVAAAFVDVVFVTRTDFPSFIRFGTDGHDLPANSTAKMYWAVSGSGSGTTDLGVSVEATQVTITSSTGTDAVITGASETEAGAMTAVDKVAAGRALQSADTVGAGKVVMGAADGTREVREATTVDLNTLASDLADGARGAVELALKSELGSGGGGGGGGTTNLSVSRSIGQVTIRSSSGTDAVLPAASTSEAGVMAATDKSKLNNTLTAAATVGAGKFVAGVLDGSRTMREASDADLDGLAGDLADGARGANELALKSELGSAGGGTTDLSVTRTAAQVTVASSTGTDATLPAASTTEAGVLSATDKGKVDTALTAAATVDAGKVVTGATDGSRAVREASDADLDSLAGDLASGDRGGNELALKTELPTVAPTNLSVVSGAEGVTIASSTGSNANISRASNTIAGVMAGADKAALGRALQSAATINSGKVVTSAGGRSTREATDADLDALAGDLASGDRGGNELALKTEIPAASATNLSVSRDATEVTVASSTGTDATLPAASATEAGVMTAADKGRTDRSLEAAATINSGKVVTGAGGRNTREATDADLDALAGDLASADRGTNELALKSEVVAGNTRGDLLATSSTLPTAAVSAGGLIGNTWAVESGAPTGVGSAASSLHLPELRPSDEIDGVWVVSLVDGTEFSEVHIPWGYAGESIDPGNNKYKYSVVKFRDAVVGGHAASFVDAVRLTNSLILIGVNTALPSNSTVRVYLSVGAGAAASSGGGGGGGAQATDLAITRDATSVVVTSSTGADATIPAASGTEAGVMTGTDKTRLGRTLESTAAVASGSVVVGAGARNVRAATDADLDSLAGEMASGDRGANELALKTELPTVAPTNLAVTRAASEVTVTSSTGTDADIPAASTTEAGVMSATDKGHLATSIRSTATVDAGHVVTGATDGSRNVRQATAADLTALATSLADGARGDQELALKSELGTGVIRANETLIDDDALASGGSASNRPATLFTLSRAMLSGAILVFRTSRDADNLDGKSIALCLTNEILGLPDGTSTAPSTANIDDALKFMTPQAADHGWGHDALVVWRHTDADKLWIASSRGNNTIRVDLIEYTLGGGSGGADLSVTRAASQVTVVSSSGTDAVLPAASATEAGVLSSTDKGKVDNALTAAATIDAGNVVMGATDASRAVRAASDADLDALAGALADGARGGNELALKTEIGSTGGGTTNLGVSVTASAVTVTSSTGTDASLPAASTTEAGVMTSTDKAKVNNATEAAATIDAGKVVMGASDGSRSVREASDADLDSLAGDLASGDRGANELALKSELPTGGGGATNLSVSRTATQVTVASSTGTDAVLPAASTTQAGVMTSTDKSGLNSSVRSTGTFDGGKPLMGATDNTRNIRQATVGDLNNLARDLADGARGANELALKSELPTGGGGTTNLGVTRTADNVVVTSSTGTDATLPAASVTEAGVMTSTDKNAVSRAITSAANVDAGQFIAGSADDTRNVRAATDADLDALAGALAADARGGNELALKSELGSGGGGGVVAATRTQLLDDVNYTSLGSGTNARPAVLYTMSRALSAGTILSWETHSSVDALSDGIGVGLCFADDVLGLPVYSGGGTPRTDDNTESLRLVLPRDGDHGFAQEVLHIWRHSDDDKLWLALGRPIPTPGDGGVDISLYEYAFGSGGGGLDTDAVDARIAQWARIANLNTPLAGFLLANAGVATVPHSQVNVSSYNIGSLVFNLEDQHFYRVMGDRTHATYPLRIEFTPTELSTDAIDFFSQGYARGAVTPYAAAAHGELRAAPFVQVTIPGTLDAVIAVTEDDRSAGTILIGVDSTSSFVPARFRWKVGSHTSDHAIGYDAGVEAGVHRYFVSSHLDRQLSNPFRIAEGQVESVTVDFDILDASGASIAPNNVFRYYLQRIDLPGTVTGYEGNVSVPYGRHMAPQPQSGILIDTATGDEYYARRAVDTAAIVVEPVQAGVDTYGLAPGNGASFNAPAGLSRLTWDPVTGLVDVEGADADLDSWKTVRHLSTIEGVGAIFADFREARLVEVPAANTPLGTRRKRALMCDWHSGLTRFLLPDGGGFITPVIILGTSNDRLSFEPSSRKLTMRLRASSQNDDGQVAMMQRITPDISNTTHWRVGIPSSADDNGLVPSSGVWGELGGGLHPAWFEISLRAFASGGTGLNASAADQLSGSHVDVGYRVQSGEVLWLAIHRSNEAQGAPDRTTETFEPAPATALATTIKLQYDSSPTATGAVQRHRYVIDPNTASITHAGFPAAMLAYDTHPYYVAIVVGDDSGAANFTRSLEPVSFNAVEIEGVPIPMTITERRMVLETGSTPGANVNSELYTYWESEAFGTGQEVPLVTGTSYAINYVNSRGVRGRPYLSNTHPPSKHVASAFLLQDSAEVLEQTTDGARAWWEVRSRGLPRINAPPQEQGAPWRLQRWGDSEHRAVPETTANDVQGYVIDDPDVSGGFLVVGWSRTVMHQLADGGGSVVLERVEISAVSNSQRFLRVYVATGGSMPDVNMRIENHTQKWIHNTGNVSTSHHNYWQVQILTAGLPISEGDEIRLRLWAGTHTPIAWNHEVNSWRPV